MTKEESILLYREVSKLNPSSVVELYELDATPAGDESILYFHNGTTGLRNDTIHFKGQAYAPMPIQVRGFEMSGTGEPPRPVMTIHNVGGWVSTLMIATKDLVGAKLTRRRTFARFLDGQPEEAGIEFPPDIFTIEQKTRENRILVEFELGSGFDLDGVMYPLEQVISNHCSFTYRGQGCGFSEPMVFQDKSGVLMPELNKFRGRWVQLTVYAIGESVVFNNSFQYNGDGYVGVYVCLQQSYSLNPGLNTSYWKRLQRYRGLYDSTASYLKNDVVHTERLGNKLYSLASQVPTAAFPPPNDTCWKNDICSKTLIACKFRFDSRGDNKDLPFGGYPGTLSLPEV